MNYCKHLRSDSFTVSFAISSVNVKVILCHISGYPESNQWTDCNNHNDVVLNHTRASMYLLTSCLAILTSNLIAYWIRLFHVPSGLLQSCMKQIRHIRSEKGFHRLNDFSSECLTFQTDLCSTLEAGFRWITKIVSSPSIDSMQNMVVSKQ